MKNNSIAEICDQLNKYDKFLLTSHENPDGDSLGSVLASQLILNQLGIESQIVLPDPVPTDFSFLPRTETIKTVDSDLATDWEAVLILDCGTYDRVGEVAGLIENQPIINIDHHPDNTYFGDYNLATEAAATVEILYRIVNKLSEVQLTKELAEVLATGLITDTGSFKYSNAGPEVHRMMADLLEYDVDSAYISRQIMGTNSYESLLLRGLMLENLEVASSGEVAWGAVTQDMLDQVGATQEDTEGLVGYPRSLEGVEVGVLFKEVSAEEIKVSLRSNSYLPVNEVAHKFDGGGHSRAAGCLINQSLEQAQNQVIKAVKEKLASYSSDS